MNQKLENRIRYHARMVSTELARLDELVESMEDSANKRVRRHILRENVMPQWESAMAVFEDQGND